MLAAYSKAKWYDPAGTISGFAQTIVVVDSTAPIREIRSQLCQCPELKTCLDAGLITIWPRSLLEQLNAYENHDANLNPTPSKVMVLGYGSEQTTIYEALTQAGCTVAHSAAAVSATELERYDLVLSYGYRQILKPDILAALTQPIVNLHISLLPFNRGASPNFWSFYDNTPSGVTIHHIDAGTYTGPILFQRLMLWSAPKLTAHSSAEHWTRYAQTDGAAVGHLTFARTYQALRTQIEELLAAKLGIILQRSAPVRPQHGTRTYHKKAEFPDSFVGYEAHIAAECARLHGQKP